MIDNIIYEIFPVGVFSCNCVILGNKATKEALIFDPGGDEQLILNKLEKHGLIAKALIHTHAHFDHFLASGELKKLTGASIFLNKEDLVLWNNLETQCGFFNIPYQPVPSPDHWLSDDYALPCGCDGVSIHTPGHTPGSMSFYFSKLDLLIAGDTLFRRSIGRTDLWGGDFKTITNSIQKKLFTLDEKTLVIPGHGAKTTIGEELRENPIVS